MNLIYSGIAAVLLAAPAPAGPGGEAVTVERRLAILGTSLSVSVRAADRPAGLRATEAAVRAIEAADARLSTWREDTELARLNAAEPGTWAPVGAKLAAELAAARAWWRATEGAFDPAVGTLVHAWDLRGAGRVPGADELARARAASGFEDFVLEPDRVRRPASGALLEEGGFGKGSALDDALAALAAAGVEEAALDLGGQWAFLGDAPREVGVADPRERERLLARLRVPGGSVATTGNGERGRRVDGGLVGHVLDPRTGRPAPDFGSVTVWAERALDADCLSTALFVLGPERGLAWAEARPGVEALFVVAADDGSRILRATRGLSDVELLDDRVTLVPPDPTRGAPPDRPR